MNEILLGATTFRFDGSDLMPGAVGQGSFWTGMVDYTGGKDAADCGGRNPGELGRCQVRLLPENQGNPAKRRASPSSPS